VLFVTAKAEVEDEAKGFAVGGADYLVKPISPPIVLARVKTHLALHDQKRHLADQVAERTAQIAERNQELNATRLEVIHQLGRASEFRDNETGMHIIRMSRYAALLAKRAGLSEPEVELIEHAAPMHDVGKIGVPDHILLKPGKLTAEEFKVIKTHSEIGYRIIGEQPAELLALGGLIAYTHHEKWDGTGYPRGLKEEEIPLAGRICAIADVFDALTSSRPYKQGWSVDRAMTLVAEEGGRHFDPQLAPKFVALRSDIEAIMAEHQDATAEV
ncbi:MAG: HD domain-containing protein, partial [Gammaproteobacteria bacterium]|nr:HD domain-containing protein [Gammaproteobacteria bacterium]